MDKEINPHFMDYIFHWNSKEYLIVGGYGSSKSYNTAIKLVTKAIQEPNRKILVVRNVFETLRESCFSLLKEVIEDMDLSRYAKITVSPMEIKFTNGSGFIFKGCDKPEKIKSINGVSIVWLEECSEISYAMYKELKGRLRTFTQSLHFLMTCNPISTSSWVYTHFFKNKAVSEELLYENRVMEIGDIYYHHSTVDDNFFVPESYKKSLEELKENDPDLYRIARLGRFGTIGIKVFHNIKILDKNDFYKKYNQVIDRMYFNGMDFGFIDSFNAISRLMADHKHKDLYIFEEYYKKGMTDDKTLIELRELGYDKIPIIADNAEQKTIAYFNQCNCNFTPCRKGGGSVIEGLKKLKRFKNIYILDNCVNAVREFKDLSHLIDKDGNVQEDKFNLDPHLVDATRYALRDYEVSDIKGGFRVIDC